MVRIFKCLRNKTARLDKMDCLNSPSMPRIVAFSVINVERLAVHHSAGVIVYSFDFVRDGKSSLLMTNEHVIFRA